MIPSIFTYQYTVLTVPPGLVYLARDAALQSR